MTPPGPHIRTCVTFHPDDRFLVTAGRRISFHTIQTLSPLGDIPLDDGADDDIDCCSSVAVSAAAPLIAAGTQSGAVAVWDYKTKQKIHCDRSRHSSTGGGGGTSAVEFAPLDGSILYSIGSTDGALCMQDLRAVPFHIPTMRVGTGIGLTCMSVREDYEHLAVGTVDGRALLYDPRHCGTPVSTLRCGGRVPVTSLHWQHTYQSLTTRAREAVGAGAGAGAGVGAGVGARAGVGAGAGGARASLINDNNTTAQTGVGAGVVVSNAAAHSPPLPPPSSTSAAAAAALRRHKERIQLTDIEPPRKLTMSPLVSGGIGVHGTTSTNTANVRDTTSDVLSRFRRVSAMGLMTSNTTGGGGGGGGGDNRTAEKTVVVEEEDEDEDEEGAVSVEKNNNTNTSSHQRIDQRHEGYTDSVISARRHGGTPSSEEKEEGKQRQRHTTPSPSPSPSPSSSSWRIPAVGGSPVRPTVRPTTNTNTTTTATTASPTKIARPLPEHHYHHHNNNNGAASSPLSMHKSSPQKGKGNPTTATATTPPTLAPPEQHSLHHDILALHLDMLNQFKESQQANEALIAGMVARQEALAEAVHELRREVRELTTRRDTTLWL